MYEYIKSHEEHAISPLTISPNHNAWPSKILKKFLDGFEVGEDTFAIHKNNGLEFFADFKAWDEGSDFLLNKLIKNKSLAKKVSLESNRIVKKLIYMIRSYELKDFKILSNKDLSSFLSSSYKLANDLCAYGYVPVLSDHFFNKFTKLLKSIIKEKIKKGKLRIDESEAIFLLCSYNKFIPSKLARIELLKIIKKNTNKIDSQNNIKKIIKHYHKWFWVDFGHLGPALSQQNFLSEVVKILKNKYKINKELDELLNSTKILRKKQVEFISGLNLDNHEKFLFSTAREFTYLKGLRMEVLFGVCAIWSKILDEISIRNNIDKKLLYYSSIEELVGVLSKDKKLDKTILKQRSEFCVWIAKTEHTQIILTGKMAKNFLKSIKFKTDNTKNNVLVVHGTVASLGKAKGVVKIVNKTSEIDKVEVGDILISVATHPGLLPAMRKASAFITDAGGITSHAAIVARELGKPCIIGTKIATQVFKDGDMVEVNTKNGNIKKIS